MAHQFVPGAVVIDVGAGTGLWLSHPAFGHVVPLTCVGNGLYRYEPGESRAQFLLAVLSPGKAISAGECVYVAPSYDPWVDAARNAEGGY